MQQAGGYPIPSSVVDLLNVVEPSYHNVARSMEVVNKAHTMRKGNCLNKYSVSPTKTANAITFRDVQKSTVSSAFNLDLKMSKSLPSSPMATVLIAHGKNPASARLMMADWRNRQHSFEDGQSVTPQLQEETIETTTDQLFTTTDVVVENLTTTTNDTISTADRTRRGPRTHYGEADDKRWFSVEVATNADRKSPSQYSTSNLECPCLVNKLQPDIRFPDEHDKEVGEKIGDGTDWRKL
ncbi:unnamed protein product [Macrosiphum euphorbiae]|uniref:Uncharacterized protein n=1 Tax=Macrosiphum euphorbiae TaxID=13131 RepID=A0AAV0WEI4_9HEMI|nr:unnamed protein product [Macrosiphum euphorbiae]